MLLSRYLRSIPRNMWLWLALATVVASYLLPWLSQPHNTSLALLAPLSVTTICIMHLPEQWRLICTAVAGSIVIILTLAPEAWQTHWRELAALVSAQAFLAASSYLADTVPWGYAQTQSRLADRLKRQSKRLQTFRESQENAQRTVQQFETDRRSLFEHLPVHVVQKNRDGKFTFVSRSFCELVGQTYEELIGKTDFDVFPRDAASKFVKDDRWVMETGNVFSDVERTQLPDGTISYMQVRKAPMLNPASELVGVQGIFWDVTKEHTSRRELQRIESLTRALFNAALDAVLIVDADGHVLEANPASQKILGYTRDTTQQHPPIGTIMQTSLEEPGGRATDPANGQVTFERKIPISEILHSATGKRIEAKLRRSDARWFDGEISAHPLNVDGSQGWAIFIRDITRRKKSEKDLLAAKNAAEQANAAKTEFVANVSHELRTPLTGIIGLHELLDRSQLDDRQKNYLKLAKLSAGNLLTLIDDLLDFSKIEAGHLDIETVAFSLIDCVEEAINSLAARAQFKGLEILIDFDDQLPDRLLGDPHRIRQILLNLVGNAIKFTERGEIRVHVTAQELDASAGFQAGDSIRIRCEVHDSGIGVNPEKRLLIFEAFRQADSSTTRRFGGTGLGLTICRDLVHKMQGEIGIADAQNLDGSTRAGSCFFFELPLVVGEEEKPKLPLKSLVGEHVVIAATPSSWRELLHREVKRLGFEQTLITVNQLINREPAQLFAAGNHTIVIADYRELSAIEHKTAPVVTKWILLSPLYHEERDRVPTWLSYSDVCWLPRPIRRRELRHALTGEVPRQEMAALSSARLADKRTANILLVEDSPISQTVLRDMLEGLGHHVTVADNGRAAVKKCQDRLYDLVLMDIQMPDVDGLEATRQIRHAELGLGRRQKICALTAHATAADRVSCEQAGMDGFLVKPISLDTLATAVAEAMGRQAVVSSANRSTSGSPSATREPAQNSQQVVQPEDVDASNFALDRAFEGAPLWPDLLKLMNNNEKLLRDVLALLTRESPKLGRAFRQAVQKDSMKDARRAVHTLKGNVRHVGLTRIAAFAEHVEYLARDEKRDQLKQVVKLVTAVSNAVGDWAEEKLSQS